MYLNILDPNQNIEFITPGHNSEDIVRTGVISDGSCLIHCILFATSAKYRNTNIEHRKQIVEELRKSISESISRDQYIELNNGEVSKLGFSEIFQKKLDNMYTNVDAQNGALSFFKSVIYQKDIESIIQENINTDLNYIGSTIIIKIVDLFRYRLRKRNKFKDKIEKVVEIIKNLFQNIITKSMMESYEDYKKDISLSSVHLGYSHLELLESVFGYNLLFIDGKTRLSYNFGSPVVLKHEKNIVMVFFENHYEIIGIMNDTSIKRKFDNDDSFIIDLFVN